MMEDEKWVTVTFGDGTVRRIPESKIYKAQEASDLLRSIAKKPWAGYTEEEADRLYSITIVPDED